MCREDPDDATSGGDNANAEENEAAPREPVDNTRMHTWVFEPATTDRNTKSFTDDGLENIANHKYVSGHYTALDNLLNPFWNGLTELLPMWLAPNAVTFLGFLHIAGTYFTTWYYSPNFDTPVPDWTVFLSGWCTIAYYTLDCMDGKQARRTGQSSPLGQLFDHGFDCISNMAHTSTHASYLLLGGTGWFFAFQGSLFFAFFMAQWEEYYTGQLPHAWGNFGVTEVNYFLGVFSIWNSFIDRDALWLSSLGDKLPEAIAEHLPAVVRSMELRHVGITGWIMTSLTLMAGSVYRTTTHPNTVSNNLRFSALSKLFTPLLISIAPFWLPDHTLQTTTRHLSIASGLLMSFLACKIICFSMAKQSFASLQLEAVPFWAVILLLKCDARNESILQNDLAAQAVLGGLCAWYAYRLVLWGKTAIRQICDRLDIYCFSIKHPKAKAE